MLPAGGSHVLGNAVGKITLDTSSATKASQTMRGVGKDIAKSMDPAGRAIASIDRQLDALNRSATAGMASRAIASVDRQLADLASASRRPERNIAASIVGDMGPAQQQVDALTDSIRRGDSIGARFGNTMRNAWQGIGRGMDSVAGRVRQMAPDVHTLRQNWLATTVAMSGFIFAARKGFQALERGAELELTAKRFDNLARSIGTTGDALQEDIINATSGMLSSAQAMSLATDLIGLGLVNTREETVRLARIVAELDVDITQLSLTLSNQTTRRFDTLGVSIAGFDDRLSELKETMSDEDAFLMAFLEQAEASIERAGGAADTTAGDVRRLKADWAELNNEIERWLALQAGPVLRALSGRAQAETEALAGEIVDEAAVGDVDDLTDALERLRQERAKLLEFDFGLHSLLPTQAIIDQKAIEQIEALDAAMLDVARSVAQSSGSLPEFRRNLEKVGFELDIAQENGKLTEGVLLRIGNQVFNTAQMFEQATAPVDEHTAAMMRNDQIMRQYGEGTDQTVQSLEDLDRVLNQVNISLDQHAQDLARIEAFEARREGIDSGDLASRRQQEALAEEFELGQQRTQAILDWFENVQQIETSANMARIAATAQAEAQRTQVIASFNLQRAREEEDFQRQRARAEEDFQEQIDEINADRAEREAEWAEDLNERLAKIQEEAARDRERMEQDHYDNLIDAAANLDATAVFREQRRFGREQTRFEEDLQRRIDQENEAHETRIQQAREADQQRIEDMRKFHERRLAREDEDRAVRLARMEEDHNRQLAELDRTHQERVQQINNQAREQRAELDRAFMKELHDLGLHNDAWLKMQEQRQDDSFKLFENFWDRIDNKIGGASTGGADGRTGGDRGRGRGGGGMAGRQSAQQLMQTAIDLMQQSGWDGRDAYNQVQAMQQWTAEEVARWIESTFGVDIPGYRRGIGRVPRTGLAMIHQDEMVLDRDRAQMIRAAVGPSVPTQALRDAVASGASGGSRDLTLNVHEGAIVVNPPPGTSPEETAMQVGAMLERYVARLIGAEI